MDTFNSGKMNVQYQTIETTQNGELEMYDTKYHSPEPVYSTPEPAHGFQRADSREPLRGYSDSSGNGTQEGLLRKLRSRFSSAELVERLGKSKGRPQTLKSWFFFWAGIFMSLLWCAPAIALITLNATNHVIGASAWCPSGYCPGVPVGTNESLADLTGKAEHGTHNFIGALQFVAKALEVWFTYISVTIVYLITSILARSEHGLPIGYLLTYMEFTDLLSVFKPTHWTAANLVDGKDPYKAQRRVRKFYLFAVGVALLCVLTNLIGPGIAVLLIPTVQWVQTPSTYPDRFSALLSAAAPTGKDAIPYCNASDLAAEAWDCTRSTYDFSLDSMVDYFYAQLQQDYLTRGNLGNDVPPPTQEKALAFQFNVSALNEQDPGLYSSWAPSRQTIRGLSDDQEAYYDNVTNTNSVYSELSNSITLNLQRQGPITSVTQSIWAGNMTKTLVDDERSIHCYFNWVVNQDTNNVYAKCFQAGAGWNASGTINSFETGNEDSGWQTDWWGDPMPVMAKAWYSAKATYVRQEWNYPNWTISSCFPNGTLPSNSGCDYDKIFSATPAVDIPKNYTAQMENAFIVENTVVNDTSVSFVVESYLTLGFTTYAVDVTNASYSSMFGVVQVQSLPDFDKTTPVIMNSSWYMATWSVNDTDSLSYYRYSARAMCNTIQTLYGQLTSDKHVVDWDGIDVLNWGRLGLYTVLQSASLLPYNTTNPATDGLNFAPDDTYHPSLVKNAYRQVYAFGIDSRTSILGLVTTLLGILVAIARAVLAVWTRVRHREPVELLVAAMKHPHRSEFEGVGNSERSLAKVRFAIKDDHDDKIIFQRK